MSGEPESSRRWEATATVASILAWAALIPLIGVSVARPQGTSDQGCLDVCLTPALWIVLDLILTPVVILTALAGAGAGWIAKSRKPTGPGRAAWLSSVAALLGVVATWAVLIATGPHS